MTLLVIDSGYGQPLHHPLYMCIVQILLGETLTHAQKILQVFASRSRMYLQQKNTVVYLILCMQINSDFTLVIKIPGSEFLTLK